MERIMLAVFLILWSSGAVFAKLGLLYSTPLAFLFARFSCASLLFLLICTISHTTWPQSWQEWLSVIIAGILLQTCYQIGCFYAINSQFSPGLLGILLGLQPLLTILISKIFFKETILFFQWIGLLLGLLGLSLITINIFIFNRFNWHGFAFTVLALAGITIGSIFQKINCANIDPKANCTGQYLISTLIILFLSVFTRSTITIQWTWQFIIAILWMVLGNSIGTMIILFTLIKKNSMTKISSLFYAVPPLTAFIDYLIFREKLHDNAFVSMVLVAISIFLINKPRKNLIYKF